MNQSSRGGLCKIDTARKNCAIRSEIFAFRLRYDLWSAIFRAHNDSWRFDIVAGKEAMTATLSRKKIPPATKRHHRIAPVFMSRRTRVSLVSPASTRPNGSVWFPGFAPRMKRKPFSINVPARGPLDARPSSTMIAFMCGCSRRRSETGRFEAFLSQSFLVAPSSLGIGSGASGSTSFRSGWIIDAPSIWWWQIFVPSWWFFTRRSLHLTVSGNGVRCRPPQ